MFPVHVGRHRFKSTLLSGTGHFEPSISTLKNVGTGRIRFRNAVPVAFATKLTGTPVSKTHVPGILVM